MVERGFGSLVLDALLEYPEVPGGLDAPARPPLEAMHPVATINSAIAAITTRLCLEERDLTPAPMRSPNLHESQPQGRRPPWVCQLAKTKAPRGIRYPVETQLIWDDNRLPTDPQARQDVFGPERGVGCGDWGNYQLSP
jgi:hypothetical protein